MTQTEISMEPAKPITPEIISDMELGDLLSAIGNHEGKALLVLAMQPEIAYSAQSLHKLIEDLPGANDVYTGSLSNQFGYCQNSFEPIGLVAKVRYDHGTRYELTDGGVTSGKILAGLLLDVSLRHKVPLQELFGMTGSRTAIRSPFLRNQIIQAILTANEDDPLNISVIAEQIGTNRHIVGRHIRDLATNGLIELTSWDIVSTRVAFSATDKTSSVLDKPGNRTTSLSANALKLISEEGVVTLDKIAEHCRDQLTESEKEITTVEEFKKKINVLLHGFEKRGVLARTVQRKGKALVHLTDEQRSFWEETVNTLEQFRTGDPSVMSKGLALANSIVRDTEAVKELISRAYRASPHAEDGSQKDIGQLALRLLGGSDRLSVREMVRQINEISPRKVSIEGVRTVLIDLETEGKVTEDNDNGKVYSKS